MKVNGIMMAWNADGKGARKRYVAESMFFILLLNFNMNSRVSLIFVIYVS